MEQKTKSRAKRSVQIVNEIKRSKVEWVDYVWRKQESIVNKVLRESPRGKRPLQVGQDFVGEVALRPFLRVSGEERGNFGLEGDGRKIEKSGRGFVVWQDGLNGHEIKKMF